MSKKPRRPKAPKPVKLPDGVPPFQTRAAKEVVLGLLRRGGNINEGACGKVVDENHADFGRTIYNVWFPLDPNYQSYDTHVNFRVMESTNGFASLEGKFRLRGTQGDGEVVRSFYLPSNRTRQGKADWKGVGAFLELFRCVGNNTDKDLISLLANPQPVKTVEDDPMIKEDDSGLLHVLTEEREHLKARNAVIISRLGEVPRASVERSSLVGEQMGNNLRLKQLNADIADAKRRLNGGSPVADFARAQFKKAADQNETWQNTPVFGDSVFASSLSKRQVTALVSMHAVITTVFNGHTLWDIEASAGGIAEAAWAVTDAMLTGGVPEEDDAEPEDDVP